MVSTQNDTIARPLRDGFSILLLLGAARLLLHLGTNLYGAYGLFRDEYYYLACSQHLAWGYVDQPPLSIALVWLSRHLFGDSLFALRLLPSLCGALTVIWVGILTKELGGGRFAQTLAALMTFFSPLLLAFHSIAAMNAIDILIWVLAFHLLVLIVKKDRWRHWLLLGLVLGLGLMNKISVLWLGAGLVTALLLTPQRRLLLGKKAWTAAALALLLFAPHLVWQVIHQFPTLEFMHNAAADKYLTTSPLTLFKEQILHMNPLTLVFWLPGLFYALLTPSMRPYRILPLIYLTIFVILSVNGTSKSEYLGTTFTMLFALGALTWERIVTGLGKPWLRPLIIGLIGFCGLVLVPLVVNVLPVERYIGYAKFMGVAPSTSEKKELGPLPQFYADMFGWEEMVAEIARVYWSLPPEDQARCAIVMNNYGEAGAVDYHGEKYGLPKAICGHNNYWLWGARGADGSVVIRIGGRIEAMRESYEEVVQAGLFHHAYVMPYENDQPIWIARKRLTPLLADWREFKHYE